MKKDKLIGHAMHDIAEGEHIELILNADETIDSPDLDLVHDEISGDTVLTQMDVLDIIREGWAQKGKHLVRPNG